MTTSPEINEIATALAKAQGAIEGAVKGKENPHFRSKYADLGAVWDACREQLSKHGIAVIQPAGRNEDGPCTFTRLMHSSGQWLQDGGTPLLLSKNDMQGLGSALTYSRRYGLMAMVGIAPEDDDGNAAVQKNGHQEQPQAIPAGFNEWWVKMQAVAKDGTRALERAWTTAKPDYRQHLSKTNIAGWEKLKALAAQNEQVPA